jgi:L-seryl-tRNA(Ser) seleniumtransferase
VTLAALGATLEIHRAGRALEEIPVLRQLTQPAEETRNRAEQLVERMRSQAKSPVTFSLREVLSAPGGGALPEQTVASWAIAILSENPDQVSRRLRLGEPAVFGRVQEDCVLIDLRTVDPNDDKVLFDRIHDGLVE